MEGQMNLKHGKHGKDSEARFAGFVEGFRASLVMRTELGRCAIIAPV
jgi:hypothetical protein